jgi:monoamine oxidase
MKKTTKTNFLNAIQNAFKLALEAEKANLPTDVFLEKAPEHFQKSRRHFLEISGKTLVVGSLSNFFFPLKNKKNLPKIAIIGAGLAGLNALHYLQKMGLDAVIFESSGRTGGRVFTVQEAMGEGTWTEFGGEFIDSNHADIWTLIEEFGLETLDLKQKSEQNLHAEFFFFENKHRTLTEVVAEFRKIAPILKTDLDRLPDEISWKTTDLFVRELDQMSIADYLKKIGAKGWFKTLLESAFESEYGRSCAEQSSLNFLFLISPNTENGSVNFYGESDERFKIKGGNQKITNALAEKYAEKIHFNHALNAIFPTETNRYLLDFGANKPNFEADYVILTIPFTKLREVNLTKLNFPIEKLNCINSLSYGHNAKLMLGMKSHFWRKKNFVGLCFADNGISNGWDNAQLQTENDLAAGLSILMGGDRAIELGNDAPETQKNKYLPLWDAVFKGATENFNGKIARMHWPTYPHSKGGYVCPTVGQVTTLVGWEQTPIGQIFFAGEHCGGAFAGFMNGAAQSGREAAVAIFEKIK